MNLPCFPQNRRQGSILIGVILVVVVLSLLLGSVLRFSSNTQRNSVRQTRSEKAKLVAESEMEYLFYRWIAEVNRGTGSDQVATRLIADGHAVANPSTDMTPFSQSISSDGWQIARSIAFYHIPGTVEGSAIGKRPGTEKTGRNYYFVARVRATKMDPTFGRIEYRAGRRFVRSETSLLQYAVFYQDDLEIASGSTMKILGPVSTNGSAYIGAQTGAEIYITDKISVGGSLNGGTNGVDGTTLRKPGATGSSLLHDPIWDPDLNDGNLPTQATQRALQYEKLSAPENFIGGVDMSKALLNPAYGNDPNEIYRSIIGPPPTTPLSDDPTVGNRRMYNRAGIVVTVTVESGLPVVNIGTPANPTFFNGDVPQALRDQIFPEKRKDVFDKREDTNVKITTMDVERLNYALQNTPTLANAYNGVLYVHDATGNTGAGSAIRMKNAEETPMFLDANNVSKGFAVVSNNAVYVQGDYNTKTIVEAGVERENPSAIMADAVTFLSQGWNDVNSTADVWTRRAEIPTPLTGAGYGDADVNTMTVNSAILTGNTPSTDISTPVANRTNSGGVQNIVRLMEDWDAKAIKIKGSIGQLFRSKYMTSTFKGPGTVIAGGDYVYGLPGLGRELEFDDLLAKRPPPWTPTTTEFHRGDLFSW